MNETNPKTDNVNLCTRCGKSPLVYGGVNDGYCASCFQKKWAAEKAKSNGHAKDAAAAENTLFDHRVDKGVGKPENRGIWLPPPTFATPS